MAGKLAGARGVGGELGRAPERDHVQPLGLGEDLVVVAGESDQVEAAGGDCGLERAPHQSLSVEHEQVLARYAARAAARRHEAEDPHPSSSTVADAASESASQSGSRGSSGRSRKPQ